MDQAEITIYADGSGKASAYLKNNLATIEERERVLQINRAFIEKHKFTLAGCYWRVGYLDPEIEISWGVYRGVPGGPKEIARLWPDAKWERVRDKYSKNKIHWCAQIDGVTLIIQVAEELKPAPLPADGQQIDLSSE